MTIEEIISECESQISRDKSKIERIIKRAKSEGRKNLTEDEDNKSEELFDRIDATKAKLANARAIKAEMDAEDAAMRETHPVVHATERPARDETVDVATGKTAVSLSADDSPKWTFRDGALAGKPAALSRDQRFADSPVVQRHAASNAERDKYIIGEHGDLAHYLLSKQGAFSGMQSRAMSDTSASAIVPTLWSSQIIDLARPNAVCLQAGVQVVPMDALTVQIGRLTQDPAPAFKNEGNAVAAGDLSYDYIQLQAKTLSALVVCSIEFLADAPGADTSIMHALSVRMGLEIDKAILFGQLGATGTNDEGEAYALPAPYPKGVLANLNANYPAGVIGEFPANGTAQTNATPWSEINQLVFNPLRNNEKVGAIISNVQLVEQYANMYDSLYEPIRKPELIASLPWLTTNAIPSYTRGTMTNRATDVFAGDFSQVLLGQRMDLSVRLLTERYAENGQVGILAFWRGDVAVSRPKALACYRAIQGAA